MEKFYCSLRVSLTRERFTCSRARIKTGQKEVGLSIEFNFSMNRYVVRFGTFFFNQPIRFYEMRYVTRHMLKKSKIKIYLYFLKKEVPLIFTFISLIFIMILFFLFFFAWLWLRPYRSDPTVLSGYCTLELNSWRPSNLFLYNSDEYVAWSQKPVLFPTFIWQFKKVPI